VLKLWLEPSEVMFRNHALPARSEFPSRVGSRPQASRNGSRSDVTEITEL